MHGLLFQLWMYPFVEQDEPLQFCRRAFLWIWHSQKKWRFSLEEITNVKGRGGGSSHKKWPFRQKEAAHLFCQITIRKKFSTGSIEKQLCDGVGIIPVCLWIRGWVAIESITNVMRLLAALIGAEVVIWFWSKQTCRGGWYVRQPGSSESKWIVLSWNVARVPEQELIIVRYV